MNSIKLDSKKMDDVKLISTTANIYLAEKISNYLNISLCKRVIEKFSNSETKTEIKESIRGKDVFIISTGANSSESSVNDYIMEALLLIQTCKLSAASSITVILACYPYSRQDRKDESRVPISAKLVANMLEVSGANRIITMDLHSSQIQGFFNISVDNIYSVNLVEKHLYSTEFKGMNTEEIQKKYFLVSPDAGAAKRTLSFGKRLNLDTVIMHKQRNYQKMNTVDRIIIISEGTNIKGKIAIICDDMCDTGGTLIAAVDTLIKNGVESVITIVTHGILSGKAIERLNDNDKITKFITSDTLPQDENMENCKKIEVFSTAEYFGEVIKKIILGGSISFLF